MDVLSILSRIEQNLKLKKITKAQFYKDCGITSSAYSQWNTGKTVPSNANLQTIADYFGVSYEYLIAGAESGEDDSMKAAFFGGAADGLSKEVIDELWQDAKEYAAFKAEQRRKQK